MDASVIPAIFEAVTSSCNAKIPRAAAITVDRPIKGATIDAGPLDKALNMRMNPRPKRIPAMEAYPVYLVKVN